MLFRSRSGRDSAVVGIVGKSKSLDFPTMLIFWSLVRNSVSGGRKCAIYGGIFDCVFKSAVNIVPFEHQFAGVSLGYNVFSVVCVLDIIGYVDIRGNTVFKEGDGVVFSCRIAVNVYPH